MKKNLFSKFITFIKKGNTIQLHSPLSICILIIFYLSIVACAICGINYIKYSHDTTIAIWGLFIGIIGLILPFIPNLKIRHSKKEKAIYSFHLFTAVILCLFILFNILLCAFHLYPRSREPMITNITLTPHNSGVSAYNVEVTTNLTAYHINIYINGIALEELTQYHETNDKHIFTTTIEPTKDHSNAKLTAEIVLPEGKKISSGYYANIPETETPIVKAENVSSIATPTVVASCRPVAQAGTDLNAIITATTNFHAVKVALQASTPNQTYDPMNMHSTDGYQWMFGANFYEEATFTIVVTAYDAQGNTAQTSLNITYPFE
ncbi:MAG: hypothetical protein IJZ76_11715 [Lachnospiraceae bacterium]|nr:hypothetical protein [Lachnospiraceae bacterium]